MRIRRKVPCLILYKPFFGQPVDIKPFCLKAGEGQELKFPEGI